MRKKIRIPIFLMILVLSFNTISFDCNACEKCTSASEKDQQQTNSKDIIDTAIEAGKFKTLLAALKSSGVAHTLKGEGPFTVFAPTDDAFAKLPKDTITNLLKPEGKETLTNILTYHVAPEKITTEQLLKLNGKDLKMSNGKNAKIEIKDNEVYIDGAKIVVKDILAKNGIIHVIDAVMMP